MLPTKFRFIWSSGFRGADFKKSANQKQELPVAAMFVNGSEQNVQSLERTFHKCFSSSYGSFGYAVSEMNFQKSTNQKQEQPVAAMFVIGSEVNEQSLQTTFHRCFLPNFDLFMVHLAKRFQRRRFFRNQPIRNKNCLWWPCLLTVQDEMSNLYRGPSIDAYQVQVHLAKQFQRRFFFNSVPEMRASLWLARKKIFGPVKNQSLVQMA